MLTTLKLLWINAFFYGLCIVLRHLDRNKCFLIGRKRPFSGFLSLSSCLQLRDVILKGNWNSCGVLPRALLSPENKQVPRTGCHVSARDFIWTYSFWLEGDFKWGNSDSNLIRIMTRLGMAFISILVPPSQKFSCLKRKKPSLQLLHVLNVKTHNVRDTNNRLFCYSLVQFHQLINNWLISIIFFSGKPHYDNKTINKAPFYNEDVEGSFKQCWVSNFYFREQ